MALITVEQAARRLNRTERTVRRWITQENKLSEHHPTHGHKDKFLVDEKEVEALAQELAQYEPISAEQGPAQAPADLIKRLERIEHWLGDLQRWQSELESRITAIEQGVNSSSHQDGEASPASPQRDTGTSKRLGRPPGPGKPPDPPADLPADSMLIKDFAEMHGVNSRTFRDQVVKGAYGERVAATERLKPGRTNNEIERWLTPEQQGAAIAFWQEHGTVYSTCPECPHGYTGDIVALLSEDQEETTR